MYIFSGFQTSESNQYYVKGSYINGSTCYAENPSSSNGVYAYARCCNLNPYTTTCSTYKSDDSTTADGNKVYSSCSSGQMMGCTAATYVYHLYLCHIYLK